jgi:hypothetical protein
MGTLALITFDSEAKAYQGAQRAETARRNRRDRARGGCRRSSRPDSGLVFNDAVGFDPDGAATGSIIGMLVGLLAGPLGLLLG